MAEKTIQAGIFKTLNQTTNIRLFRNNIGLGFVGKVISETARTIKLLNYRRIKYGLQNPGGSDLIGFTTVKVTPGMVGKNIAVFTAVEVKAGKNKATEPQENFIAAVKHFGGFAGVAKTTEAALNICSPDNI